MPYFTHTIGRERLQALLHQLRNHPLCGVEPSMQLLAPLGGSLLKGGWGWGHYAGWCAQNVDFPEHERRATSRLGVASMEGQALAGEEWW